MALYHKGEYYTHLIHTESGKTLNRRLHQIMVQRGDGGLVELKGADLPDSILTFAGNGHKDLHKAYIYSRWDTSVFMPNFRRHYNEWPTRRDFVHFILGVLVIAVLRFIGAASAMSGY